MISLRKLGRPQAVPVILPLLLLLCLALSACGQAASAASCAGNVANVGSTGITIAQFRAQLRYTLGFYEHGNTTGRYYGVDICHDSTTTTVCRSIKKNLVSRMIDQQIVSDYAAAHNLIPTSHDWALALRREAQLVRDSGGQAAFAAYLAKVDTDQAQFRFLESEQIETAKVTRSVGASRFRRWLDRQEKSSSVVRCPLQP